MKLFKMALLVATLGGANALLAQSVPVCNNSIGTRQGVAFSYGYKVQSGNRYKLTLCIQNETRDRLRVYYRVGSQTAQLFNGPAQQTITIEPFNSHQDFYTADAREGYYPSIEIAEYRITNLSDAEREEAAAAQKAAAEQKAKLEREKMKAQAEKEERARIDQAEQASGGKLSRLRSAVESNNIALIKQLLAEGVNGNFKWEDDFTPMHGVTSREAAQVLIDWGANINAQTKKEKLTPLMMAFRNGNEAVIDLLIDKNCNLTLTNSTGGTVLFGAVAYSDARLVKKLISKGLSVNSKMDLDLTPIFIAVSQDDPEMIQTLIQLGADASLMIESGKEKLCPMSFAISDKKYQSIKALLQYGGEDVGLVKISERNMFERALKAGDVKAVKAFVEAGFPCQRYFATVGESTPEVLEYLLGKGMDVNSKHPINGGTALHSAATYGNSEVVQQLLLAGIDTEALNLNKEDVIEVARSMDQVYSATGHPMEAAGCRNIIKYVKDHRKELKKKKK